MDAPPTRAELAALYAEDNRRRAEHEISRRQWQQQEAAAAAQARENEEGAVEYRTADNNALETVPAAVSVASDEEGPPFNDEQIDVLEFAVKELRAERDHEIDLVITELRAEFRQEIENLANRFVQMVYAGESAERLAFELQSRMLDLERNVRQLKSANTIAAEPEIIDLPENFLRHTRIDRDGKVLIVRRDDAA
jgi:hypothetical protein